MYSVPGSLNEWTSKAHEKAEPRREERGSPPQQLARWLRVPRERREGGHRQPVGGEDVPCTSTVTVTVTVTVTGTGTGTGNRIRTRTHTGTRTCICIGNVTHSHHNVDLATRGHCACACTLCTCVCVRSVRVA